MFKHLPVVATALALAATATIVRAEVIEQILVKVNGEIFTKTDLESRQVQALRARGQTVDPKSDPSSAQLRKALDDVTPDIVLAAVDEMLVVQRGRELGYKLSDEQFKQIVDNIKKDNHLDTDAQWDAALKQEGMSMPDLRRSIERNWIVSRVQQNEVFGKIGVTEDEARSYYDAHLNEFTTPPTISVREILVNVPNDGKALNVGADEVAKQKAEQIRARAAAGESFEKLASDLSDAPSHANAGLIGPISMKDLSQDMREIIQPMKVGDVSQVLRTPRGYQILKLESSTPPQTMAFEEAREQISNRVFTDKRKLEFDKYLDKLREEAIIEWKNPDIKRAFEAGLEQQRAKAAAGSSD